MGPARKTRAAKCVGLPSGRSPPFDSHAVGAPGSGGTSPPTLQVPEPKFDPNAGQIGRG